MAKTAVKSAPRRRKAPIRMCCDREEHLAVAVCLLFSYLAPEHEERIAARLEQEFPGLSISVSHRVSPTRRIFPSLPCWLSIIAG